MVVCAWSGPAAVLDMKLNAYTRCTKCRNFYRDEDWSCEICGPAKAHLETPRGSDAVNSGRAALEMMEAQLDDLRAERKRMREQVDPKKGSQLDKYLMRAELDCVKALSILLEHIRKQTAKEAAEIDQLTPEEKLEVFLDMVETLPPRLIPQLEAGLRARQLLVDAAPPELFQDEQVS